MKRSMADALNLDFWGVGWGWGAEKAYWSGGILWFSGKDVAGLRSPTWQLCIKPNEACGMVPQRPHYSCSSGHILLRWDATHFPYPLAGLVVAGECGPDS